MLFLHYANYSDGYRAGVPIKISHKGKIIKTHEGELNEGGLTNTAQGVLPSKWAFSIKDSDSEVRVKLEEAIEKNKRVKVYYEEKTKEVKKDKRDIENNKEKFAQEHYFLNKKNEDVFIIEKK